jgi:DNA polymerase-3 subunit epsilon
MNRIWQALNRPKVESLLMLISLGLFIGGGILGWVSFFWLEPGYVVLLLPLAIILLIGSSLAFYYFWRVYRREAQRLTAETKLIRTNPAYRIKVQGSVETQHLAQVINAIADHFQGKLAEQELRIHQARADLEARIHQAKTDLEEEKNRLLALMSELSEGVVVCNNEGQILLYNHRAQQLLGQAVAPQAANGPPDVVDLEHSIYGLIEHNSITYALAKLDFYNQSPAAHLVSKFVTIAKNGQLLRARIAPVLGPQRELSGFILTLEDITRQLQTNQRRDLLLQSLIEGIRASLGNIRAAIETIEEYPEMDEVKLNQLKKVIYDESLTLSTNLNQTTSEYAEDLKANWQLEEMLGSDLVRALQYRFKDKLGVTVTVKTLPENLWLNVDSYGVVQALTFIMRQIQTTFGAIDEITLKLKQTSRLAVLDIVWPGLIADMDTVWAWQNQAPAKEGAGSALSLRQVAERHGGEVWCQTEQATSTTYFRLLLPIVSIKTAELPENHQVEVGAFEMR